MGASSACSLLTLWKLRTYLMSSSPASVAKNGHLPKECVHILRTLDAYEKFLSNWLKMDHPVGDRATQKSCSGKVSHTFEVMVPIASHSTHVARWPAPTYLPDAFRRTGHTVVSPSILADGPPEFSKCAVLFQRVGALGSEVLIHSRIPDSAVRHIDLLGEVLECPETQKGSEACEPVAHCRDTNGLRGPPEDRAQLRPTVHIRHFQLRIA